MNPKKETQSANTLLGHVLVLVLSLIWGLAFVAIRRAAFELSPATLTLARWLIASAGFLILAPVVGRPKIPFERRDLPRVLLLSLTSVGGYHLSLNYAERIVSSGLAGLLISFGPVFAVLLSAIFLRERMGHRLLLALGLAVLGAVVLSVTDAELSFLYVTGPVAVVFSALMYGVFSVASKPLATKYGAFPTAIWAAVTGTLILLPLISTQFVAEVRVMSIGGWLSVLYLAIGSTVIANMILYTLISTRAVSTLSVQLYLVPVISVIGGVVILSEAVTLFTVLGGILLLASVALATQARR